MRPTWAEISRGALLRNYSTLQAHAAGRGAGLLCVVKANAYGHGLALCAPALASRGVAWFGVTGTEEGVQLRGLLQEANPPAAGEAAPEILLMGGPWKGEGEAILEHGLTAAVWEPYQIDLLENAARRAGMGPRSVGVHLEVDTGMSRQGTPPELAGEMFRRIARSPCLKMTGLCTHFASADAADGEGAAQTVRQTTVFCRVALEGRHLDQYPQWLHAGNSATLTANDSSVARLKQMAGGLGAKLMLRPGLGLYGYLLEEQSAAGTHAPVLAAKLEPVLRWKTRINSLRHVKAGAGAGYNAIWTARRDSVLALLPVGYADGLRRALSGSNSDGQQPEGRVRLRGAWAPIVGRVSMDLTIADVTDVPGAEIGDEVELLGEDSAAALGRLTGTIPYEVLCDISDRVPRISVP